jgi:hypothetical protein
MCYNEHKSYITQKLTQQLSTHSAHLQLISLKRALLQLPAAEMQGDKCGSRHHVLW